ncbi:hypothetical protein [Elizabethkingia ursingii]|uniref:hypothetical protein n=1 Tax=Elizabethkingia ursingii TaxID=1756150 RepID=UPI001FD56D37|nr:hypothetical protein [Elizabethkingia ursingii]
MNKKLFFASLWGIFTLSLLSSCRTEDGVTQQKQNEAKYFKVFIPKKENETINYANGFAFLMKRYDELQKTNLSGVNNKLIVNNLSASTEKNASVFQNANSYVEFNIRSEVFTEKNGDKWVAFPKIQGEKVTALVVSILTDKKTYVKYLTFGEQSNLYKVFGDDFQEAFSRYRKQLVNLRLNAAIKPIAGGEILIREVIITVPRPGGDISLGPWGDDGGSQPGGGCGAHLQCDYMDGSGGGGGGGDTSSPSNEVDKIDITDLQEYPCAFAIAQQLPYLDNNIAKLLIETFGVSNKINVTFKTGDLGKHDGRTNMIGDRNNFDATITLDRGMLSTATKEFILATMYHEVLHAYLLYEWTNLGSSSFYSKYPAMESYDITFEDGSVSKKFRFIGTDQNHNRMGPFINGLKNAILQYNPKYPSDRAEALAMGGILDDGSMPKGYDKINQHEKDGSTAALGQKCRNN